MPSSAPEIEARAKDLLHAYLIGVSSATARAQRGALTVSYRDINFMFARLLGVEFPPALLQQWVMEINTGLAAVQSVIRG